MKHVTWENLDWNALDRLRSVFLAEQTPPRSYWSCWEDLANYDLTFGRRIAWKWDAVLRELRRRGWTPPPGAVLDWGCGSGVAGRRVLETFGAANFTSLFLHDRSDQALDFAAQAAREAFPGLRVERADAAASPRSGRLLSGREPLALLVVSHVLTELDAPDREPLLRLAQSAQAILWVEPGTFKAGRDLVVSFRERLRGRFRIIAPCTHQAACGLLAPHNDRHWCHNFADPPEGIMADSHWVRFARRAGIDLRSLPYSFLALEKPDRAADIAGVQGCSRIIGRPRYYKGYALVTSCQEDGVYDLTLRKRDAATLFKALKDCGEKLVYRWERADDAASPRSGRITGARASAWLAADVCRVPGTPFSAIVPGTRPPIRRADGSQALTQADGKEPSMKLYIHTDIEGVAGMVHFEDRNDPSTEGYFKRLRMHKLLTGEVNAAIEGALEAGVREILVNDSHGSGYSILFEELNPAAQIIHGPLTRQPFWMPCLDSSVDLLFCVAQHAMAQTNGVLAHSLWYCNDLYFGEAGMAMALAGCLGIPAVLVTGDNTCCAQVRDLAPQIETVVVKEALSPYNAKSWTPARAREMIKAAAARAVRRSKEIPPFRIKPPYKLGFAPRPGTPPQRPLEGNDFHELVMKILLNGYHYDLQKLPIWPMEPGYRIPALHKSLLKKWEEEHKTGPK